MKKVEAAKWDAQRPADRPAARHSEEMSTLERERFTLAKNINDLESSLVEYESVLASQKSTLIHLQEENAMSSKEVASRADLEWNLYKQLGIDWIPDGAELSAKSPIVKCRVVDQERNDIHIISLDDSKMSAVDQANLLWSLVPC